MKWMVFVGLAAWPAMGIAQDNSVSIYKAEMQPIINQFVFAGEISACGLRDTKWINDLQFFLIHMEANVAVNLWSDGEGKMSKFGEKQLDGAMYKSGEAFSEGQKATGKDCLAIVASDDLTDADKAIAGK